MNDNQPMNVGDRVRLRGFPFIEGNVWSIEHDMIIVQWDDPEEHAQVRNPRRLEKITQASCRPVA